MTKQHIYYKVILDPEQEFDDPDNYAVIGRFKTKASAVKAIKEAIKEEIGAGEYTRDDFKIKKIKLKVK